jgi:carbamoyl-phosphate synthase large subunit
MRSTGEVMGLDADLGLAFAKSQMAAQPALPAGGDVFVSVKDGDKPRAVNLARRLSALGFGIVATAGTGQVLADNGVDVKKTYRLSEGRPNVLDLIKANKLAMIINTPLGTIPRLNENIIRQEAVKRGMSIFTTISGADAAVSAMESLKKKPLEVKSLQEYTGGIA